MNDLLPFIISGLAAGAIYGLAGTGLVLTYKTSGLFNFGYGAMATISAYVFYFLQHDQGVDWKYAFILSVLVLGPLMGMLMEPLARRLATQPLIYKVAGTVGIIVCVQGFATIKYGADNTPVTQYFPKGSETFQFAGVNVGYDQLILMVVALVVVFCLFILFAFTRMGTLMRAVVDDADLMDIQGTSPTRVRRIAWSIGSTLASLCGVLVVPIVGLEPIVLTFLIVQAFGAAAVGAFSSIPLTFVGGLIIGLGSDISRKYVLSIDWLSGLPASLPFLLLLAMLLLLPKRKLASPSAVENEAKVPYKGPAAARITAGIAILIPLALVPIFAGVKIGYFTMGLSLMIVLMSLGLLVKTSGQVSLCHAAFMAMGAGLFSYFTVQQGLPWVIALFLAAFLVVPVGALIAIPAIRLSGLFLALATFGFGIMVQQLLYPTEFLFGRSGSGREIPRPGFAQGDNSFYYLVLLFVVVTGLIMVAIHEGRLGRILRGMSDSALAVTTFGLNLNVTKVIVFSISTFFAALGGILYGGTFQFAAAGDPRFMSLFSLVLIVLLVISPFREPWYAIPAAVGVAIPAFWTAADSAYWLNAVTGLAAIAVSVSGGTPVMPERWRVRLTQFFTMRKPNDAAMDRSPKPYSDTSSVRVSSAHGSGDSSDFSTGLEIESLTVQFGGVVAVDNLTLSAPLNRITGLIGPNGAGKTTTFNACSGLVRPTSGRLRLGDVDITKLSPSGRARHGLGRTFQKMELCDALTVAENVALGREAGQAGSRPLLHLAAPRGQHHDTLAATHDALALCGIESIASKRAGELSTGQRRLVELARCLAGPFDVLLLDEPSSGLDAAETASFGSLLHTIVEQRGCGILLVEHDVNLVMSVCKHIYVLDFGKLLFDGPPAEVAASALVQAAYLGGDLSTAGSDGASTEVNDGVKV
ncbi:MAG: ATP-binding cassette domain-containing protein [Hyphomicrobiales bacterium]|nr:MAG: ATP-binding cassette domain-containing protein [Hyphomicrobiales bacterium]